MTYLWKLSIDGLSASRTLGNGESRLVSAIPVEELASALPADFTQTDKDAAIAKTYHDVDAVYVATIGEREPEYRDAEIAARAYIAAGYTGAVSPYISGWAIPKGLSNAQSADSIVAKADTLAAAKLALRNTRFTSQQAMQAATTQAELDVAIANWDAFIAMVKASL